jgi:nucleotide-binding universal stress UspA family protein
MRRIGKRRILIATNGSPSSAEAVELGLSLATTQGAELTFLHVVGRPNGDRPSDDPVLRAAADRARERGLDATVELADGKPCDAILALGERLDASMIVVGSGGRMPFKGRVACALATRSLRPVLVARRTGLEAAA